MQLMPNKPLIKNERNSTWKPFGFRGLWARRELLYFLVWRDLKVRYKQTLLGVVWVIIQPLFTVIVFTLLFDRLARMPSDNMPYALFAYAALLVWTFFSNAATNASLSLIGNPSLITKVYFPRAFLPGAAVVAVLVDLFVASPVLIALMVYHRVRLTPSIFMLPGLIVLVTLLALAVGMLTAALNVKYRDVRYALPFMIQLWMFVSPVVYPLSAVPGKWRWVMAVNPLAGVIEGFRVALFGHKNFDWSVLAVSALGTFALLLYAGHVFRRMEREFADVI